MLGKEDQAKFIRLLLIIGIIYVAYAFINRSGTKGRSAPAIELTKLLQTTEDQESSLASLKDKYVVLDFWATWCGPCKASIPHLNELAAAFRDQPVQFLAVTKENEQTVTRFLEHHHIDAWVGLDRRGATFKAYGIEAIPRTLIINPAGRIIHRTHPMALTKTELTDLISGQ